MIDRWSVFVYLPRGLDGEFVVDIANGEPLSVYRTDGDAPFLLGSSGQLRDVASGLRNKRKKKVSVVVLIADNQVNPC